MLPPTLLKEFREDYKSWYNLGFIGSNYNFEQKNPSKINATHEYSLVITMKQDTGLIYSGIPLPFLHIIFSIVGIHIEPYVESH